jgi:hypothetical protein
MPNDPTPARPELPTPDLFHASEPNQFREYYRADTVRRLLADERRKTLLDAAWAARPMNSGRAAETVIRAMIDKEPTT